MKKTVLSLIAITVIFTTLNAQNVTIPDAKFKACLIDDSLINVNGDSEIQLSEATSFSGAIKCNSTDITGIESFTSLTALYCENSSITSFDLSTLLALDTLSCYGNQLSSLDITNNVALRLVWAGDNNLTTLDVTNNTALTVLHAHSNNLTGIDISKNTALLSISLESNNVTALDVSNNLLLEELDCQSNDLTSIDVSMLTALTDFTCAENNISSLDVTKNSVLREFYCDGNNLTVVDITNNLSLTGYGCDHNNLTSVDVSQHKDLTLLYCGYNLLTSLNVQNGTTLDEEMELDARNNPHLTCIQVDDVVENAYDWEEEVDSIAVFSLNCAAVSVNEATLTSAISIFPNPSDDHVTVNVTLNELANVLVNVCDLNGVVVASVTASQVKVLSETLDLTELANGVYFVKCSINGVSTVQKLIVAH
jgi:hypothetical protein